MNQAAKFAAAMPLSLAWRQRWRHLRLRRQRLLGSSAAKSGGMAANPTAYSALVAKPAAAMAWRHGGKAAALSTLDMQRQQHPAAAWVQNGCKERRRAGRGDADSGDVHPRVGRGKGIPALTAGTAVANFG
eukprot:gene12705-biopygen12908